MTGEPIGARRRRGSRRAAWLASLAACGGGAFAAIVVPDEADAAAPATLDVDDEKERGAPAPGGVELLDSGTLPPLDAADRATRLALDRGLAWLAERQRTTSDGALPALGSDRTKWAPVGVTALGALAFLADGTTPRRGTYQAELDEMVNLLAGLADMGNGSPERGFIARQGDRVSRTHGHGYATLVLAQAYGMSGRNARLGQVLEAAVRRIEDSQGAEGGWGYLPTIEAFHEGSVTIAHVQALRAARNVGIDVDDAVIRRADAYVRLLQKEDGTFRYTLDDERSSIALTAAAVGTLNATGTYDDPAIQSAIDAIFRGIDRQRVDGQHSRSALFEEEDYPFYMRLYLSQALWQLSDPQPFERWWAEERKEIVRTQRADGSWGGSPFGDCYATAVNCLALAVPDGVLPIFQR